MRLNGSIVALIGVCLLMDVEASVGVEMFNRPSGAPGQSRSMVVAQHGIVATSQPLAAQAGLEVLQRGGSAADAAIATCAALGVVEPMSCGVGGDLFVIYWDAKTQRLYGLNGSGRSPLSLSRQVFADRGLAEIPETGPLSWSVPGCVAGWHDLHQKFGQLPWSETLARAATLAEEGFPVSEVIARDWQASEGRLRAWPDSARTYLPQGRAPVVGEMFRNPGLARSLKLISAEGPAAFYQGSIAAEIAQFSEANGGFLTRRDLAEHRSEWVDPVSTNYRGYDVWELPPNGQGIAALQMLNLLEPHDLKSLGHDSPEYWHLFVEAKKLAFADRAVFYADPASRPLPIAELISKPYAAQRAKLMNRLRAQTDVPPGNPKLERGDTIYLTVVDKDRNCCSMIQSLYYGFGSQVVPGNVGFALQNRGTLFALDPQHLNTLEPGKRPFHTIIPSLVTKEGKPWLVFGVMGGDMQAQGHVQILVNTIDFGMNIQLAGDAARVRHSGSATPTGQAGDPRGGVVAVEPSLAPLVEALRAKGHQATVSRSGYGGYQAIEIDWEHGTLRGASEVRKDGCAVGY